jgi:hypothetical protein
MKKYLSVLFILGCFFTFMEETVAQISKGLPVLKPREFVLVPSGFYIRSVRDERLGQDSTGFLLFSADGESLTHKIKLKSASLDGIREFISHTIATDTSLIPLTIRIRKFDIKEALSGHDDVSGEIKLQFIFERDKDGWSVPLTNYEVAAKYIRQISNLSIVEPTLRNLLTGSMKFIDKWISDETPRNPNLAKRVKLSFRDYTEQHDDTVYYDPVRPLVWADFRESRRDAKFAAEVFPSFGYDQYTEVENGIINVDLFMKVFMVKSASWVSPVGRTDYNLNHEQRHFDLVKIIAQRFKSKLLAEKLNPDNYQGVINFEYLAFYREMNRLQKEYDEETSHGKSQINQALWDRRIDEELSSRFGN